MHRALGTGSQPPLTQWDWDSNFHLRLPVSQHGGQHLSSWDVFFIGVCGDHWLWPQRVRMRLRLPPHPSDSSASLSDVTVIANFNSSAQWECCQRSGNDVSKAGIMSAKWECFQHSGNGVSNVKMMSSL